MDSTSNGSRGGGVRDAEGKNNEATSLWCVCLPFLCFIQWLRQLYKAADRVRGPGRIKHVVTFYA